MNPTLADQVRQKYAWAAREVIQREFSQLTVPGACCGGSDGGECCSTPGLEQAHPVAGEMFAASITARKSPA